MSDSRNTSSGSGWGWLGALLLFFLHVILAIVVLLVVCWVVVGFVLLVKKLLDGLGEYIRTKDKASEIAQRID